MVGFSEKLNKRSADVSVSSVEESSSNTSVTSTTGTTNSVDVVINIRWKIAKELERKQVRTPRAVRVDEQRKKKLTS